VSNQSIPRPTGKSASNSLAKIPGAGSAVVVGTFLYCFTILPLAIAQQIPPINPETLSSNPANPQICQYSDDMNPEMVIIAPGRFQQGSQTGYLDTEIPVREVEFSAPFAVGRCEVTVAEFRAFVRQENYVTDAERKDGCLLRSEMSSNSSFLERRRGATWQDPGFPQSDRHPVTCVSWNDAQAYIDWLNTTLGLSNENGYRLPSESEWEYATRADSRTEYFWGDGWQCGFSNASSECDDGSEFTAPVASFQENNFGLFDTAGNVYEWVQDCHHDSYEGAPTDGSAWEADCGRREIRVVRGGSWYFDSEGLRSASRNWLRETAAEVIVGFRLARTL